MHKIVLVAIFAIVCILNFSNAASFKDSILDLHNRERRLVGAPDLKWAGDLAQFAAEHAKYLKNQKKCQLVHRTNRKLNGQTTGENLARWIGKSTGCDYSDKDPGYGVCLWNAEKKYYKFGKVCSNSYQKYKCGAPGTAKCTKEPCGHYVQNVYGKTREVGCAHLKCVDGQTLLVCNYRPAGNILGTYPFDAKFANAFQKQVGSGGGVPKPPAAAKPSTETKQYVKLETTGNGCKISNVNPRASSSAQRIKVRCGLQQEGVSLYSEAYIKQLNNPKYGTNYYSKTILAGCNQKCEFCSVSSGSSWGPWC